MRFVPFVAAPYRRLRRLPCPGPPARAVRPPGKACGPAAGRAAGGLAGNPGVRNVWRVEPTTGAAPGRRADAVKPLKVYVASSWRNDFQPGVVRALRSDGHQVYDFKGPGDGWGAG